MEQLVLIPGHVQSKYDNDTHYIDYKELANLYGVNMNDCLFLFQIDKQKEKDYIYLYPRYEGDYKEWLNKQYLKGKLC